MESPGTEPEKLTPWQRFGIRRLRREAGRGADEPLAPDDWEALWRLHGGGLGRSWQRILYALPSTPRCGICSAPFGGIGSRIVGPLGHRPSRKNPTVCSVCVESSPPGGMMMRTGVLFADVRGFTARLDGGDAAEMASVLGRFYSCAESVLFPDALIDKLIGDEVMALYLPEVKSLSDPDAIPAVMLQHAHTLLKAVGYGSGEKPFVELGIGLDFGEAFVGNIGKRALYDFTAVGDVVNTAARLQSEAAGGEIILSDRVAEHLPEPVGRREELELKGKAEAQVAYRVAA